MHAPVEGGGVAGSTHHKDYEEEEEYVGYVLELKPEVLRKER